MTDDQIDKMITDNYNLDFLDVDEKANKKSLDKVHADKFKQARQ